jgi:hypothetical protein
MRIMVPSIPESGTKSRVETQIRVTVDLADTNSLSSDPSKYDRIGSWKWLKLPPGTATKRRTRKQGKIGLALLYWVTVYLAHSQQTLLRRTFFISQRPLRVRHRPRIAFSAVQVAKHAKYSPSAVNVSVIADVRGVIIGQTRCEEAGSPCATCPFRD